MRKEAITRKNFAEFFAGIGLVRMGLENAGWNAVFANDISLIKRKLYLHNFPLASNHFILEDIHSLSSNIIPNIDLATASFPCTDLSLAGKREGLDGRHSSAFWGFIKLIREMGNRKPKLILLENVLGFLTSNKGKDFEEAMLALNHLGYSVDAFVIDASRFVPQSRVRLFVVGKLHIEKNHSTQPLFQTELRPLKLINYIKSHSNINWSINQGLPSLPILKTTLNSIIETIPKKSNLWWDQSRVNYLLNQTSDRHLSKLLLLQNKKSYSYITAFRRKRNGRSMAELRFDGIAGCLRTPKGGSAKQILIEVGKGEINVRLLTPKECGNLMGANEFKISGSVNEALYGFGDAVCVPVISWIAENYLNHVLKTTHQSTVKKYAKSA